MWSWTEISTSRDQAEARLFAHICPTCSVFMCHFARVSTLPTAAARTARKSRESYPPSLPSAPVTPSSTAPTNTKLLAASICRCDPPPLVHVRNFRGVFTFPTEELAVVTLFFFSFGSSAVVCSLPNLSDFLPGICACRLWSVTARRSTGAFP